MAFYICTDAMIERSQARAEWRKCRQKSWANVAALIAERTAQLFACRGRGRLLQAV
jgi:hypothetical protein